MSTYTVAYSKQHPSLQMNTLRTQKHKHTSVESWWLSYPEQQAL